MNNSIFSDYETLLEDNEEIFDYNRCIVFLLNIGKILNYLNPFRFLRGRR